MSHRGRDNCFDPESEKFIQRGKNQPAERLLTSKQLFRLACSEASSAILRKHEADEATAKDNAERFLGVFSPAKLSTMKPKDYDIFENPEYNANLPGVIIVYAFTHLERGWIADYIIKEDDAKESDVDGYLREFPGHGAIELGVSFEPDDNGELEVYATLLQEIDAGVESGFSNRAMGVVANTVSQINQPAE